MKNHRSALLAGILLIACLGPALADSVVQVWLCDFNEGKTRTNVLELSAAWIEAAKSMDGGIDKLTSSVIGKWEYHASFDVKICSKWALTST